MVHLIVKDEMCRQIIQDCTCRVSKSHRRQLRSKNELRKLMKSYTVECSVGSVAISWLSGVSQYIVAYLDSAFDRDGWILLIFLKIQEILYCAIVLPSLGWVESPNLIWSWRMKCAETDDSRLLWISDARWRENCPNHNFFKCNSKWIQNLRILTLCNSVAISWLSGVSQ